MVGCPKKLQTSEEDEVTTHVCYAVDSETCQLVNISATESRDHVRKSSPVFNPQSHFRRRM
jgi:hypothetical protein